MLLDQFSTPKGKTLVFVIEGTDFLLYQNTNTDDQQNPSYILKLSEACAQQLEDEFKQYVVKQHYQGKLPRAPFGYSSDNGRFRILYNVSLADDVTFNTISADTPFLMGTVISWLNTDGEWCYRVVNVCFPHNEDDITQIIEQVATPKLPIRTVGHLLNVHEDAPKKENRTTRSRKK